MGTIPALPLLSKRMPILLPTKESPLVPEVPEKEEEKKLVKMKERQAHYHNRSAKDLKQSQMTIKDSVRIAPYDGIGPSKEWQKE